MSGHETQDRAERESFYLAIVRALQASARAVRESHGPSQPVTNR